LLAHDEIGRTLGDGAPSVSLMATPRSVRCGSAGEPTWAVAPVVERERNPTLAGVRGVTTRTRGQRLSARCKPENAPGVAIVPRVSCKLVPKQFAGRSLPY
jgi:hypothetical protein